ncbi:ATP-binding protein [Streptomyces sp. NPDC101118]|uniref:ATP-binding protein n=1 Tax=Streptomyces sp. NPDC101118 TaxID=3366109 RepID=UPI003827A021
MGDPVRRHCECGIEGAAARAREETRRFFEDARAAAHAAPCSLQDSVLLVVSELVTNAVHHTRGPCSFDIVWSRGGIDVDVTDSSPEPPTPRPPVPEGTAGGYGWPLVHRLADEVDVRPAPGGGKSIHVHFATAS